MIIAAPGTSGFDSVSQGYRTTGVHLVGPRFRMFPAVRPFSIL